MCLTYLSSPHCHHHRCDVLHIFVITGTTHHTLLSLARHASHLHHHWCDVHQIDIITGMACDTDIITGAMHIALMSSLAWYALLNEKSLIIHYLALSRCSPVSLLISPGPEYRGLEQAIGIKHRWCLPWAPPALWLMSKHPFPVTTWILQYSILQFPQSLYLPPHTSAFQLP